MDREAELLLDVAVALGVALAAGWIATRLRLSSIVGYVVAGVAISPFTPGFEGDPERLRLLADIGIVLLLFSIGVQFSLAELAAAGPRIIAAALAQTAVIAATGAGVALAVGSDTDEALYVGAAAAISSSVVMVKVLDARGEAATEQGHVAVAWSIVQDLATVVLIVVLAAVADEGGDGSLAVDVLAAAAIAAGFLAVTLFIGLRAIPLFLNRVAEERSRELFFLAIAALVMGTALASEYVGLSLALGAFLAGIVVSESDLSHRVLGELLPTRDVFAVLFFVSAGMLLDPGVLRDEWLFVVLLTAVILAAKPLLTAALLRASGRSAATAVLGAALLAPAAEFSFLLADQGVAEGAVSEDAFGVVLAAAVASIVVAPLAVEAAHSALGRGEQRDGADNAEAPPEPSRVGHRAVVCGYSETGRTVAGLLAARFDVLVVEEDVRLARRARESGLDVVEGTYASPTLVERMGLDDARVLIVAIADPFAARLLVERARAVNRRLDIVAEAISPAEAEKLRRSGATQTVVAEEEVALELARHGLQRFGVSSREALSVIQRYRAQLPRE